jgi:hypothetical protein
LQIENSKYLSDNTFYSQINSKMKKMEGFYNLPGFPNDPISRGTTEIQKKFKDTLPNVIYTNDTNLDIANLTRTTIPRLSTSETPLKNEWKQSTMTSPEERKRHAACENVGNGDQFSHLSSLASSVDKNDPLRCGWVYNTGNYKQGRGALGTKSGPSSLSEASGKWMWDLNAAKKKYHTDMCNGITNCGDIGASMYQGRCGWCKKTAKAVPVSNGVAAYPFNINTACPTKKLITNSAKCQEGFMNAPSCKPLENGALPRDCLLQKVIGAGCNDAGSMYQALKSGSDNDYLSQLRQQQAWSVYQARATLPLDETSLKTGKITIATALDNFNSVQENAASELNGGLQFAARDLCYKKGTLDSYDFCTEISDSTRGPFTLDCVQKVFLKSGGQTSGRKYPSTSSISYWNSLGTWSAVKAEIQNLLAKTRSSDRITQENAMIDFYGITLENKQTPLEPPMPPPLTVTVGEHCDATSGWRKKLGIGSWTAGSGFPADASYITVPEGLVAFIMNRSGITEKIIGPRDFNFCSRYGFNDNVANIFVHPHLTVTLGASCVPGEGWQKNIGPGTFQAGSHFPADASYITVPAGLNALLKNGQGISHTVNGPGELNFCSKAGFNDNVKEIRINFQELQS